MAIITKNPNVPKIACKTTSTYIKSICARDHFKFFLVIAVFPFLNSFKKRLIGALYRGDIGEISCVSRANI